VFVCFRAMYEITQVNKTAMYFFLFLSTLIDPAGLDRCSIDPFDISRMHGTCFLLRLFIKALLTGEEKQQKGVATLIKSTHLFRKG